MRTFRNLAFVVLLGAVTPALLNADGFEFCAGSYGGDGCSCEAEVNLFSGVCTGFENCAETYGDYCEDAWIECLDMCYDYHSGDLGPFMPQTFSCVEDFECSVYCECYPIE